MEYGLLVGLLGIAILAAVAGTGTAVASLFGRTANALPQLQGEAVAPPGATATLSWSPAQLDLQQAPACATALLTNSGTVPLLLSLADYGGDIAGLAVCANARPELPDCIQSASLVLQPGGSCAAGLRSQLVAPQDGSLYLTFHGADEASGAAEDARLDMTLAAVAVAPQILSADDKTVVATRGSCTPLTYTNVGFDPIAAVYFTVDDAAFALCDLPAPAPALPRCNALWSGSPSTLAPGAQCVVGLNLVDLGRGDFAATVAARPVTSLGYGPQEDVAVTAHEDSGTPPNLMISDPMWQVDIYSTAQVPTCAEVKIANRAGAGAGPAEAPTLRWTGGGGRLQLCTPQPTGGSSLCGARLEAGATCSLGLAMGGSGDFHGSGTLLAGAEDYTSSDNPTWLNIHVTGFARSCKDIQDSGLTNVGPTELHPTGIDGPAVTLGCNMEVQGGGWTMVSAGPYDSAPLLGWSAIGGYAGTISNQATGVRLQPDAGCTASPAGVRLTNFPAIPHSEILVAGANVQNDTGVFRLGSTVIPRESTGNGQLFSGQLSDLTFTADCTGGKMPHQPDPSRGLELGVVLYVR